jgi:hypothetical protein
VSQSDDLPPPRRPLFFPVVIATVLLSIIGMSAGLVLGDRHETPQRTGDQTSYVPADQATSPVACPEKMHETARRVGFSLPMTQLLKVRAPASGLTVWICTNQAGKLFYQANRSDDEENWIEGETALFLPDVVKQDDGYFARAADGNTFFVNDQRLEVVRKGKSKTTKVEPQ